MAAQSLRRSRFATSYQRIEFEKIVDFGKRDAKITKSAGSPIVRYMGRYIGGQPSYR